MNSNLISKAVRYALVAGAATAMAAPSVFAQDTGQSSTQAQPAQLGKIEVTGTRIKRTDVETAQPVTIVTQQQLKATGLTSVGDILQTLSSTGSALNTQFNNGGDGETRIDLRNLGSQRVLVLVNGRRWVSGLGGSVDLNTIPTAVIDHIEILQDGASAIYGSDAISGVINIITIKNYNGAEANAYMGIAHGDGKWDGKQQEYDFTIGSSGDRAGVVMNVSYVNQKEIWAGNRNISKEPLVGTGHQHDQYSFKWPNGATSTYAAGAFTPWYAGSAGTPSGLVLTIPVATSVKPWCGGGVPLGGYGTCTMTLKTAPVTGRPNLATDYKQYTPLDSFNYAPLNYLVTPSERTGVYVQGHYDLADNLTFSTELLYNRRQSSQSLAPSPLYIGYAGSSQANGQNIGVSADNPYNPFPGQNLVPYYPGSAAANAWCAQYAPGGTCGSDPIWYYLGGRRPLEAGNRLFYQDVQTYQFNSGFKGYFNMLGSEWDWDLNYLYSSNSESDLTNGLFNTDRLQKALSTQCVAGSLPGCVPFDFFGGVNQATGQGTLTPAMLQYTTYEAHDLSQANMRDYTGNISGDLGDWFGAGSIGTALGYEYLSFDGYSHPDATTSSGNTSGNVTQPTDGKESTKAQYIEFNIPILSDVAFAKSLSLDIANRWSQFKWRGGSPGTPGSTDVHTANASTGRAALKWQPSDELLIRASWSQGFRLPSLGELYLGQSDSFPQVQDPCAPPPNGGGGAPYCGTGSFSQPNKQIRAKIGGNPGLTPERAISRTAGFVYNPSWLPGFDFSADYYKISLVNAVGTIGFANILNGCYKQNNAYDCSLITRTPQPNSSITNIVNVNVNIGGINTAGWDIASHYKLPSTSVGDFKFGIDWTFTKQFDSIVPDSSQASGVSTISTAGIETGSGGVPKQRANISLSWNYGDWSALWAVEYIHSMTESCPGGVDQPGYDAGSVPLTWCTTTGASAVNKKGKIIYPDATHHIGATFYHDLQASYHVESWNTDFTFGIRNLFDKAPPVVFNAFANSFDPTYYRAPGRFFYGRVSVKF